MSLQLFKYPKTPHLSWSPGTQSDDRFISQEDYEHLSNLQDVVVSVKMDGENSNFYPETYHARSLDSRDHPSRSWAKQLHGSIRHLIPNGWRICGENLYARHSIAYDDLTTFFMAFSIWDLDLCLDWDTTVDFCKDLGIETVPVLYRGPFDETRIRGLVADSRLEGMEGYVVRNALSFRYSDFHRQVAKYVRKNHVQTDIHWMHQAVVPNRLKADH